MSWREVCTDKKLLSPTTDRCWEMSGRNVAKKGQRLRPLSREQYATMLALARGTFTVPVRLRSKEQNNGILKFWRYKDSLSVKEGHLHCDGKKILLQEDVSKVVSKAFTENKSCGARPMHHQLKTRYAGLSEKNILKHFKRSERYQRTFPKFANKDPMVPVIANQSLERWQCDLIAMNRDSIEHNGSTYRYILSITDVFSRFLLLRPLVTKSSAEVAARLDEIFAEHGCPKYFQTDQGCEFKGRVATLLLRRGIKAVRSRPYHPQSQGKCERSHAMVRKKIRFASQRRKGFNWAAKLHTIQEAVNSAPKEVIGYQTPFQVFFCRGDQAKNSKVALKARKASERCSKRTMKSRSKSNMPSIYRVGEKVLVRYPFGRRRVPKRRHVLSAKVVRRKILQGRYCVKYQTPEGTTENKWIMVSDITSTTVDQEQARTKQTRVETISEIARQKHRQKYYIPLSHKDHTNALDVLEDGGVSVLLDPVEEPGSCQFASVANQLSRIGIHRSSQDLRTEAVDHLQRHGDRYSNYTTCEFGGYLQNMRKPSTYGDHLTLVALSREYNLQFLIINSRGLQSTALVSNSGMFEEGMALLTLGYFPEGMGEHYVSVAISPTSLNHYLSYVDGTERPQSGVEDEQDSVNPPPHSSGVRTA